MLQFLKNYSLAGIFLLVFAVLFGGIYLMNYVINPSTSSSLQVYEKPMGNGVLSITTEKLLDIGNIPIRGGKVTAKFSFKNTGTGTLSLFSGQTSCACTEAVVQKNGEVISPRITMPGHMRNGPTPLDIKLLPGEEAEVVAVFDPMAHGPNAIGPMKRDIIFATDSAETPEVTFSFHGNVIK